MNFFVKACMTLLMVAIGIIPAVVLHWGSLPPIGAGSAVPTDGRPGQPDIVDMAPEAVEPDPFLEDLADTPETEGTWDWTRSGEEPTVADDLDDDLGDGPGVEPDDDEAAEETGGCSYYDRSACGPADGYGQAPPPSEDPSEPTGASTEPGPGTETEPPPTEPAEDEGLLGGLLGGG